MPRGKTSKSVESRTDWTRLRAMSDDEIERIASEDEDNPPTDASDWANATIGPPPLKRAVHANFDSDVVAFFKRGGRGYQTRMNAVLRRYMEAQRGRKAGG